MKRKTSIGGLKTAKRKILVREFFQEKFTKEKKFSDPFENDESQEEYDESEWNLKPLKINRKKNHKLFEQETELDEESQPSDDILVKNRDLDEADRFIASLKFPTKKIVLQKENLVPNSNYIPKYNFKETFEKFKVESEKLNNILNNDLENEDEEADFLI